MDNGTGGPIPFAIAQEAGVIPRVNEPLRFAVGDPEGLTSNSWRVWNVGADVYIVCRDNFQEVKASLHRSGRWRMALTQEALARRPELVKPGHDRIWEVWDRPRTDAGGVLAFQLIFLTSELMLSPEHRKGKGWKESVFIEAGPPGRATAIAIFVTDGQVDVRAEDAPSFTLGQLDLGDGSWAQVVAYARDDAGFQEALPQLRQAAGADATMNGIVIPEGAVHLFFGSGPDGHRFLLPARASP